MEVQALFDSIYNALNFLKCSVNSINLDGSFIFFKKINLFFYDNPVVLGLILLLGISLFINTIIYKELIIIKKIQLININELNLLKEWKQNIIENYNGLEDFLKNYNKLLLELNSLKEWKQKIIPIINNLIEKRIFLINDYINTLNIRILNNFKKIKKLKQKINEEFNFSENIQNDLDLFKSQSADFAAIINKNTLNNDLHFNSGKNILNEISATLIAHEEAILLLKSGADVGSLIIKSF